MLRAILLGCLLALPPKGALGQSVTLVESWTAADCDRFRLTNPDLECRVYSWLTPRRPALVAPCETSRETAPSFVLAGHPDLYPVQAPEPCTRPGVSLLLVDHNTPVTGLPPHSQGVWPGQPLVARSLGRVPIRFAAFAPEALARCQAMQVTWPLLTCEPLSSPVANTIMVSCPSAPASSGALLAAVFGQRFALIDWRDDPAACALPYAIDVELGDWQPPSSTFP